MYFQAAWASIKGLKAQGIKKVQSITFVRHTIRAKLVFCGLDQWIYVKVEP